MSYESFETLKVSVDGAIATVTVAREAALNALSSKVITELTAVVGELEVSTDLRVVIVTGAGEKAFVAGADIAEMRDLTVRQGQAFAEMGGALANAIESSEKPWIAAVNGFALGGGCELALACDFIYASDKAKFGQPEVKL
ncbi:MAG TPA: enoyl-CoA hydratase-related protein, partial [Kofleriaceae bacterium]|nr:enoyl-CoA hydratase-related protein [Kofleriaceae bacterium]